MRYRLLGPLQVARLESSTEVQIDVGPPKQRAVLAALLLARGRVVSALAEAAQLSAADPLSDRGCWLHVLVLPYAAIGAVHADPVEPMPISEDHALLGDLSAETVDEILAACGPGSNSPQTIVELRLLGGALAREPQHRSAFCHRDAAYSLAVIGVLVPPSVRQSSRMPLRSSTH